MSLLQPSRRRPDDNGAGLGVLAAILGGLVAGPAAAALAGASGAVLGSGKLPLKTALAAELERVGARLVAFERPSLIRAVAVFEIQGSYFTAISVVPGAVHAADLDDWLFGDLLDEKILPILRRYVVA